MAGNKINTKTKGKEDKNKTNKSLDQVNDEIEDLDFSLLRKPIPTSVTGFSQARKIFDWATEELKGLLSNECDLLYECKVCRNIFRSLANFISHKRVYCKEKFNSSQNGNFFKAASTVDELIKIKKLEESYFESMSGKHGSEDIGIDEIDTRIPLSRDLTTIVEKITQNHGVINKKCDDEHSVILQNIPNSSVAVFQSMDNSEKKQDRMRAQVNELNAILSKDKAVLQSDGTFKIESSDPDNVIQISDDDDDNEYGDGLKCKICDQLFSTLKTLKFHMKYKHLESRLVYPCPDCLEIFSTSWSVYRHLFKVHRKTAAQIRRLRESIQSKAFRMNNPPAFYEKRKNMKPVTQKISEEERLDQENKAWLDNVEGAGGLARCFGCGRSFERRAALAAHAHTCPPRRRAAAADKHRRDTKKIEIQIRKDYNKGPQAVTLPLNNVPDSTDNKTSNEEEITPDLKPAVDTEDKEVNKQVDEIQEEVSSNAMDEDEMSSDTVESPEKPTETAPPEPPKSAPATNKLPFAHQAEKSNLTAFRQRIQPDIEVSTLMCKKCDLQHDTVQELYDHMASHYKWMRYACKLCNFKTYYFSKLPEHVKTVHKLKGNSDFYFSTVKAIDGTEALELSGPVDEVVPAKDASPDSRRQSRCSSDSSRLSDDSSSSSTRVELGSRKRKMFSSKNSVKRRKQTLANDEDDDPTADMSLDRDSNSIRMEVLSSMSKTFEENSSDMDDLDEKVSKRQRNIGSSVASRRPVRKKTKRKNEDFEYDLSNLLKMEAQGYRESQVTTTNAKTTQKKKAPNQDNMNYYEIINRDCCGALTTLSKKAVEVSAAHYKNTGFTYVTQKDPRSSNIFVRPMIPKIIAKTDKNSPKKELVEETKDTESPQKEATIRKSTSEKNIVEETKLESLKESLLKKECLNEKESLSKKESSGKNESIGKNESSGKNETSGKTESLSKNEGLSKNESLSKSETLSKNASLSKNSSLSNNDSLYNKESSTCKDQTASNSSNYLKSIPSVVPIKFCRKSLELIKNPIINKNITDFKKAGMKTKILVVKPINRSKDGSSVPNSSLKFQTIKLKDPTKKSLLNEEKPSGDQVVVVKVPKVETISRKANDCNVSSKEKLDPVIDTSNLNNNVTNSDDIDKNVITEAVAVKNDEEVGLQTKDIANEQEITANLDSITVSDENELVAEEKIVENGTDST